MTWQVVKVEIQAGGAVRSTLTYDGLTLGAAQRRFRDLISQQPIWNADEFYVERETEDGEQRARFVYPRQNGGAPNITTIRLEAERDAEQV